jgi:DNA mismatch repair protein MutS2
MEREESRVESETVWPVPAAAESIGAKTRTDLAWPRLCEELALRCHTERGSAAARTLPFASDAASARERIAKVGEARLLWQLAAPMPFGGIRDVEALTERAQKGGVLEGHELLAVGETVAAFARLRRHVLAHRGEAPRLGAIVETILELAHVSGPILDCIAEDGRLHDHASPALGALRKRLTDLHEQVSRRARALVDDPEIAPLLQDRFYTQREDRYVLPVRSDARGRVKGIVHGASQSGHTVFVEPDEIVELNNKLKLCESEVFEEEQRILTELSGYVREDARSILRGLVAALELDVLDGGARLADALDAVAPEIDAGGELKLPRARHPLMVLSPRACVPSDIFLGAGQALVVSGPNAGGKTVSLKTAGLCALMARAGLHVPAGAGARVPFFAQVLTDIGDDQSLERNLSSFSAHLLAMKEFLATADASTLVLLDEVAVGTEPEQGAALAQATLEAFAARGAMLIVTTHYERLKALAAQDPRFVNASVGFDLSRMAPTFELQLGVPGSSAALLLARRMGLPDELNARANELLGDRKAGVEELMVALAEERRRLDEERRTAGREQREAEMARREAETARREAERRVKEIRKGAYDEAVHDLKKTRDELERVYKLVKKAAAGDKGAAAELAGVREVVASAAEKIAARAPEPGAPAGRPATAEDLKAGVRVLVAKLGGKGEVVGAPAGGKVTVQIGTMRTTVALADVRLDDASGPNRGERRAQAAKAEVQPKRRAAPVTVTSGADGGGGEPADADLAPARTPDATVDLRGERVDDGLVKLDRFLDDCVMEEREVVFVIHGHGTGAMKAAVRQHLGAHPSVAKTRAGTLREGGDGVTVVWLTD